MTQPSLFDVPVPRRHRRVRDTSVAAYAEARERLKGRSADVLRWLAHHWNETQTSPTSAELAVWKRGQQRNHAVVDDMWILNENIDVFILYVRRGISDLQADGLVETVEKRRCDMKMRLCHTWRVKSR